MSRRRAASLCLLSTALLTCAVRAAAQPVPSRAPEPGCAWRPAPVKDNKKIVLTLKRTGSCASKVKAGPPGGPNAFCGEYGSDLMDTCFEYHPQESRTRFLFVIYAFDEPLFDEQSIQIKDAPE